MKISQKLIFVFFVVVLLVGLMGYMKFQVTQKALQEQIGHEAVNFANRLMREIDKEIYFRVKDIQGDAKIFSLAREASISNGEFDKMADVQQFINRVDKDWKAKIDTPLIRTLLDNELSRKLAGHLQSQEEKFGHPVFVEMFVTNKYGVVIATSNRTSDYLQADEEWYQKATAEDEFWVGDIEYDESADTFIIELIVNLYTDTGNFAGVVNGALNLEFLKNIIHQVQLQSHYKRIKPYLVNKKGAIAIFNGLDQKWKQLGRDIKLVEIGLDISSREAVGRAINGNNGFIISTETNKELLSAFSHSRGFKDFKGLGWSLIIDLETDEIFEPVFKLRNFLGLILIATILMVVLLSIYLFRSITRPINILKAASIEIGKGKLDTVVAIKSKDEIGLLASTFNQMTEDLKKTTVSRDYVENIIKTMTDVLVVVTPEETIQTVNQAACDLLGYQADELIGGEIGLIFAEESSSTPQNPSFIKTSIKKRIITNLEKTLISKDGEEIPVLFSGSVMRDDEGKTQGVVCVLTDITERKQAQGKLRDSEKRLQDVVDNAMAVIYIKDLHHRHILINREYEKLFNVKNDEVRGKTDHEIFPKEIADAFIENDQKVLAARTPMEFEETAPQEDGLHTYIAIKFPLYDSSGNPYAICGISTDITQRKRAQKEQNKLLHELEKRVKEQACMHEVTNLLRTCQSIEELFQKIGSCIVPGWQYPEITRVKVSFDEREYVSEPFEETPWKQSSNIVANGEKRGKLEVYYLEERPDLDEGSFLKEERNLINSLAHFLSEAVEHKKVEEELRQTEVIVASSSDMLALLDKEYNYLSANPAYLKACGKTYDQVVGNTVPGLFGEEFFNRVIRPNAERCLGGAEVNYQEWFNFPVLGKVYLDVSYYPYFGADNEVRGFVVNGRNVTERKQAEQMVKIAQKQALASHKLAATGELLAGVSHEVMNPLNILSVHLQLLERKRKDDPDLQTFCSKLRNEVGRIEKIMSAMLLFSRKGEQKLEKITIKKMTEEIINLVGNDFSLANISIETEFCEALTEVLVEKDKMRQVFLNLFRNARHAMPEGGTLTLKCQRDRAEGIDIIRTTISDTGVGIKKENLGKIFDPFFTTKAEGKGTGLGLSVVQGIIDEHGGTITVESEEGKGTTFIIDLPVKLRRGL